MAEYGSGNLNGPATACAVVARGLSRFTAYHRDNLCERSECDCPCGLSGSGIPLAKTGERPARFMGSRSVDGFMVGKGQGISGADHFWFGHTPVDRRYDFDNLHYIDTGAVFDGYFTLAQLQ
jgi:hypothetical protein